MAPVILQPYTPAPDKLLNSNLKPELDTASLVRALDSLPADQRKNARIRSGYKHAN